MDSAEVGLGLSRDVRLMFTSGSEDTAKVDFKEKTDESPAMVGFVIIGNISD
jgi:hypothetical protein